MDLTHTQTFARRRRTAPATACGPPHPTTNRSPPVSPSTTSSGISLAIAAPFWPGSGSIFSGRWACRKDCRLVRVFLFQPPIRRSRRSTAPPMAWRGSSYRESRAGILPPSTRIRSSGREETRGWATSTARSRWRCSRRREE